MRMIFVDSAANLVITRRIYISHKTTRFHQEKHGLIIKLNQICLIRVTQFFKSLIKNLSFIQHNYWGRILNYDFSNFIEYQM